MFTVPSLTAAHNCAEMSRSRWRRVWMLVLIAGVALSLPFAGKALAAQESVFATGFDFATGIAVDAGGNVFIADYDQRKIRKFNSDGDLLTSWGASGTEAGEFVNPSGIAVNRSTGNVYVSDWNRVQQFDSSGKFIREWGSYGTDCTETSMAGSGGITIDTAGNVYTAHEDGCIQKFSSTGEPLMHFSGPNGTGPGEFAAAHGIAIDGAGNIYVADLSHRIQKFDSTGSFVMEWGNDSDTTAGPDLAISQSGALYVGFNSGGANGHAVELWSLSGSLLGSKYAPQTGGNTTIAVDNDGRLLVGDGPQVLIIDPSEPVAQISDDTGGHFVLTGTPVALSAAGSSVPFSEPTNYSWDLGFGSPTVDTGLVDHLSTSFDSPGVRTLAVQVSAPSGKTAIASKVVDVRLAPPAGAVGMTINDGDFATNSPDVALNLVWFPGATSALVSNDGGFGPKGATAGRVLATATGWRLAAGGSERLPRTVYLRYLGIGQDATTFTDDIILDTTTPVIEGADQRNTASSSALVSRPSLRRFRIRVRASAKISGISAVAFSRRPRKGRNIVLRGPRRRGIVKLVRTFRVRSRRAPRFVRVRNAAGTWSKWRRIRSRN